MLFFGQCIAVVEKKTDHVKETELQQNVCQSLESEYARSCHEQGQDEGDISPGKRKNGRLKIWSYTLQPGKVDIGKKIIYRQSDRRK